jgi:hypothetical protein
MLEFPNEEHRISEIQDDLATFFEFVQRVLNFWMLHPKGKKGRRAKKGGRESFRDGWRLSKRLPTPFFVSSGERDGNSDC